MREIPDAEEARGEIAEGMRFLLFLFVRTFFKPRHPLDLMTRDLLQKGLTQYDILCIFKFFRMIALYALDSPMSISIIISCPRATHFCY